MSYRVVIIGGGIAGLVAGHRLTKAGLRVVILERDPRVGGLAGSTRLADGIEIEKYYHFICTPDKTYFRKLKELGIDNRLCWKHTSMGLFHRGRIHTLGDPVSLMRFPHFSLSDKLRLAINTLVNNTKTPAQATRQLSHRSSEEWLIDQYGNNVYDILYKPLIELKFGEYKDDISAAWMWARFKRLGSSRNFLQQEKLAYLVGGSELYVQSLAGQIEAEGSSLRTSASVQSILFENSRVTGVVVDGERIDADFIISTVPIPVLNRMLGSLPEEFQRSDYFANLRSLRYMHARVMMMRLNRQFSPYFWMNISDPQLALAGLIEYTNLNPIPQARGDSIIYLPQYLSEDHRFYDMPEQEMLTLYCDYLGKINPSFRPDWIKEWQIHRSRYSQPICTRGFDTHIPAIASPVSNFFLTDSCQLHPDDRAISNSTDLGEWAAQGVMEAIHLHDA